jgi:DNA (cytosine-5)-methyltransferase 1
VAERRETPYHDVALCLNAGGMRRIDYESESMVVSVTGDITHALNTANNGKCASDLAVEHYVYDTTNITSPQNGSNPKRGDPVFTLASGQHPPLLCPAIGLQTAVTPKFNHELQFTLTTPSPSGGEQPAACTDTQLAVRRLTPVETERLQGFPDGHTDVPYRNKPAADGPRYKAIGNSMAVPVMAWIGRRIADYIA